MDKKVLAVVLIILIVCVGGLLTWYFTKEKPIGTNTNISNAAQVIIPPKNTVWIVDGNFTPAVVTVAVGDKITWVNKDIYKRKIASDVNAGTDPMPSLTSSEMSEGDSFSFSFTNKGEWIYHDTLNPIKKGKIIVQ